MGSDSSGYKSCQAPPDTPSPVTTPTKSPTTTPIIEGCYSNNYKDCLPNGSTYASCNSVWLPDGHQDNCIALYGDCTNDLSSCCGPAECVSDVNYYSCIPPLVVTSTPSNPP